MIKNAIVVMFDSLQHNYLGCYGNEWIKTPNMDRLAREGVLFENCYIEGLPTVPCRRAMHTGRYTLPKSGWVPLTMEDTMISDLCWGRPIDTALIFDCPMYRQPKFGYTRGFDKVYFTHGHEMDNYFYGKDPLYHFDPKDFVNKHVWDGAKKQLGQATIDGQLEEMIDYLKQMQYWHTEEDRFVAKTMKKAVEYLEQVDRNKQFFLWVDSFDPHEPWSPPSVYMDFPCPYDPDYKGKEDFLPFMGDCKGMYDDERDLVHIRALYAELVTLCDKWFGWFLDNVRRLGLEENTLLLMVSDHGEPLGYGEHGHGIMRKVRPWPYEELVHAPMLMRGPGIPAGKRIKGFVQSVDVAPTVCDWLGIGVHPTMQGKSMLPLAKGEVDKLRDFAIAGYYKAGWAIYTEDWSYVHWPLNDKGTMAWVEDTHEQLTSRYAELGDVKGMASISADALASDKGKAQKDDRLGGSSDELKRHQAAATLDGEAQWTCTPGAAYVTPEEDELYDRKNDKFQLKNVIKDHPEVAQKLLMQLRDYMDELANS